MRAGILCNSAVDVLIIHLDVNKENWLMQNLLCRRIVTEDKYLLRSNQACNGLYPGRAQLQITDSQ
jgi:hypothetical protein